MADDQNIPAIPDVKTMGGESDVAVGQWYWVSSIYGWDGIDHKRGEAFEWLGCISKIGSNYVHIQGIKQGDSSRHTKRIHFDNFWSTVRREENPETVIRAKTEAAQANVNGLMEDVRQLTQRLGVIPQQQIAQQGDGQNSLAIVTSQADTTAYKTALIKAKDEDLPALFKAIASANKTMIAWMSAGAMPAEIMAESMKEVIGTIEDRLFTVSLYAGLTEEAVKCCDGEPAGMGEPLHIMQRRLYMDEECLLSYIPGGITITSIDQFDDWIAMPEHRDRLLPFPRTLAAVRVRNFEAERETGVSIGAAFVQCQMAEADKKTFLYVRNGEQVWRIDCGFVFDKLIFPTETGLGMEPMMIDHTWSEIKLMPLREYEERLAKYEEQRRVHQEWNDAHPEVENQGFHNPHRIDYDFNPKKWELFDSRSVYFDDANEKLAAVAKQHNRLAVIVQGLYDRSMVLHPHPPVKLWDPHSFERSVKLIRDGEALSDGEPPDFEAYRRRLNRTLGPGSIVTGQEDFWLRAQAEKENERQSRDWKIKNPTHYRRFKPYGNPGPGLVSRIVEWKPRGRKAVFRWERENASWRATNPTVPCSIVISAESLFNVSAYTPGDFRQFFADHRTRQQYIKWAPLMLAAEDYHAGKVVLGKSECGTEYGRSRYG